MTGVRASTERLIQKHRPKEGTELEPCGSGQLVHLNEYGLIEEAVERQAAKDSPTGEPDDAEWEIVITKIVAWEVLADAQRNGLHLEPRTPRTTGRLRRRKPTL